jgi:hypothetical protein
LSFVFSPVQEDIDVPPNLIEMLMRIFNGDNRYQRFYTKYGSGDKKCDGKFAIRPVCLFFSSYLCFLLVSSCVIVSLPFI